MYDEIGYLISETEVVNRFGDAIITTTERLVYVDAKSIRQSEFYQAQATGLRPELMFEMRLEEYQDEPRFKYADKSGVWKTYDIIRTYEKNKDFIEIICQGIVNGVR